MSAEIIMRWYVLHIYSGYEKKIEQMLRDRVQLKGMEKQFGRIVIPVEEVVEMKSGKKHKGERRIYPGYILIQMEMTEATWYLVREVPRVMGFVGGTANRPEPLTEREAQSILDRLEKGKNKPVQKTVFSPGEVIRIIDGPFSDFNGVVETVNYQKSRLAVAVTIFGRSIPVELEFSQIEKC